MQKCPNQHAGCPHPESERFEEIEFVRRNEMVDWLAPAQLADTGIKAVVAATFGSYADKREVEVSVSPIAQAGPDHDYGIDASANPRDEIWFDYIADLGDGFNPTYAMACLLAKDSLTVKGVSEPLPFGEFLLLGGDQVYPTAARAEYRDRFIGPFRAALPWRPLTRDLYALPGNHDWYDGLTSFLRIFCQIREDGSGARWIGAWKAKQRRSYFALRLPGDWWVWAIDGQLESDLDKPQSQFFDDLGKHVAGLGGEQKVILITPEPNWVYCVDRDTASKTCSLANKAAFDTLSHFEKRYIRSKGLRLTCVISGDLHHYVHYTSDGVTPETHRITSGGGGAYLLATHQMPESIVVREGKDEINIAEEKKVVYTRMREPDKAVFPTISQSKSLTNGIWMIAWRNKSLGLKLLAPIYLVYAWILQAASRNNRHIDAVDAQGNLLSSIVERLGSPDTFKEKYDVIVRTILFSPSAILFTVVVILGLWAFTYSQRQTSPKILSWAGALHGILHIGLALALTWILSIAVMKIPPIIDAIPGYGEDDIVRTTLVRSGVFAVGMFILGWLAGTSLFGLFMYVMSRTTGGHTGEVFSSMHIEDFKNFLRFRVHKGGVDVYVIGLQKVPTKWELDPARNKEARCEEPFYKPVGDTLEPHLIEKFTLR